MAKVVQLLLPSMLQNEGHCSLCPQGQSPGWYWGILGKWENQLLPSKMKPCWSNADNGNIGPEMGKKKCLMRMPGIGKGAVVMSSPWEYGTFIYQMETFLHESK